MNGTEKSTRTTYRGQTKTNTHLFKNLSHTSTMPKEEPITSTEQQQTFDIYRKAMTFNILSRYDPQVNQLLYLSSHCVVYEFIDNDWSKLDYQGTICLYSRKEYEKQSNIQQHSLDTKTIISNNLFQFGIIIFNRNKPENFSIGIIPNKFIANQSDKKLIVEQQNELIIVKDLLGTVYGLWVFDSKDREMIYKMLDYCINQ